MPKYFLILIFPFYLNAQKTLLYEDNTYETNIKTVLVYPASGGSSLARGLQVPVIELGESLRLEFDDLSAKYEQYHVKVIHCDINWLPSKINAIEYVNNFNDEIINDYAVSQSTKVPYYHYSFEVPAVKISGNYLLVVWRDGNKDDLIITKRFLAVENKIGVMTYIHQATDPEFRKTKQQIDFDLSYGNFPLMAPKEDLKVVIKQNFRWDRTIRNLKPRGVFEAEKKLEYRFLGNENLMSAGNEFRFFDGRSTFQRGFFIDKIQLGTVDDIWVSVQKDRSIYTYVEAIDQNGLFSPQNLETRNTTTEADYPFFTFTLKVKEFEDKKVYVNGGFNNWKQNAINLMEYDPKFESYVATIQLKQGIYNFDFVVVDENGHADEELLEGNFADTENIYEIIVYNKAQAGRTDRIVGYKAVQCNPKR